VVGGSRLVVRSSWFVVRRAVLRIGDGSGQTGRTVRTGEAATPNYEFRIENFAGLQIGVWDSATRMADKLRFATRDLWVVESM